MVTGRERRLRGGACAGSADILLALDVKGGVFGLNGNTPTGFDLPDEIVPVLWSRGSVAVPYALGFLLIHLGVLARCRTEASQTNDEVHPDGSTIGGYLDFTMGCRE